MKFTTVFALAAMAVSTLAAPIQKKTDLFYLRVNTKTGPWQNRHLVLLPTSHQFGLENFTVHPVTPPVIFTPVKLTTGLFALRGQYSGDPAETPFIAAMKPNSGTADFALMFVFAPNYTQAAIKNEPDACPEGYTCVADQWTVGAQLRLAGSAGVFEPVKDASPEGWTVYWKGEGADPVSSPISLDVVPNS